MGLPSPDPLVTLIATAVLAVVFLRGLWHKIVERELFRVTLADYGLVPEKRVAAVALALTAAEALVVAGLLMPWTRSVAALAGAALLTAYAVAIAINLRRGRVAIDCGCGGPGHGISWLLVARNAGLVLLALVAALPPAARPLAWGDYAVLAAGLATVWLLLVIVEQAASNAAYVAHDRRGRH